MESRMDSIKTPTISTSVGGQAKTKYKRRSGRLQCLKSIECDSKDSSLKLSISPSKIDLTSEQGTSTCGLCITTDQPSTIFDHEIAYELNQLEQTSTKQSEEEKCVKKYTNSKFFTNNEYVETDDVSKVFKLLSKPNFQSDIKRSLKSPLKTYTNPRKSLERNEVIESFGLPDTPIIPEKPLVDSILDVEVLDAKEITFQELQFVEEPWCIIDLEESFTNTHEIRIKPDPQDHLKVCYSNTSTFAENINKSNFQKISPIDNATNALDQHSKRNTKSPKKKLSKPEIIIENNSLALEGHEVEICKVNNSHNTSNCNLTTVNTNKSPRVKPEKCGVKNKKKDINTNEKNVNKSKQVQEVSKEKRKLRSSRVTVSPIKTDHDRGNSDNKVNEVDNFSSIRKLRSSVINNSDVSKIETPRRNKLKTDKKVINSYEKQKIRTSINNSTDSSETLDKNLVTSLEVKKLRSSSITSEEEALKINNKFVTPITNSDISANLTSPGLGTPRRRDHHKSNDKLKTTDTSISNEFTSDSESATKKDNLILKEELKREKSFSFKEKRKQRFSSLRKVAQSALEASRRGNLTVEIDFPKKTKIESIKNNHKTQLDTESTSSNTARTLRAHSCSDIILKPKILENTKSSKIPKSQNHKVRISKGVESRINESRINYNYLTKSNSYPFLNTKESDNKHSKQLKVILHPLKKLFNSQRNIRKDHVNNIRSNRRFSKLYTPSHAENTEKQTRSCEMLLELVDIIPISEKPKDSSKLLQTKPFLNLFKNTELPLPKTLLVEDETMKTTNYRKPETKNATKNNVSTSKEDKSSKSTDNDTKCNLELIQNQKNEDSVTCSEVVPTTGSEGTSSSPCNMKILPEKTNLDEGMHTSPDKIEIKMTNRVKKSPETKADITELKNLIKKMNEIEGRKCKVFTNEKLSECLKTRSYNRKSSSGSVNLKSTSEFQQETIEENSLSNKMESENVSPTDKLRNRTRKIIEMLSEDIIKSVTDESTSVKSKKNYKYVQSENTNLQNNKDLIANNSEQCYQIISEKDIPKKCEHYKKKNLENVEIQEDKNILDLKVKPGSMEAANILKSYETILRNEIDTEVEAEQTLEKLETHSSDPQITLSRLLRKREEKSVDTPKESRKSILALEMVSPSENITCTDNSSNGMIKKCRGRQKNNKTVVMVNAVPETSESRPTRQLRKSEEKSVDRPKRVVTLETVLPNENIKRCRGRPKKQVNQVNNKPNEEHQEIISLNANFNSPNENVFKVSSKVVSDTIFTNNISTDENLLETEPNLIVEEIEDSSTQVTNMIMELDNTNFKSDDKCELVASTTMKHELDQTENTEVNIKSAKINEDYMSKNLESTRDPKHHVTETRELNKNYIIESTEFYKDMNEYDLAGTTEVNKSDITEITDIKKDCITKNTVGNKNDRTGITDVVADSKNKTVITVNTIPKKSSPESASTPTRQLRKREEKSVDRPKRVVTLESVLPNENIERCRGRPKKQVNQVNKNLNEEHREVISLNTDFNIPNEVSSKDVSDMTFTNNISRNEILLETESNLIVEEIEDSSTQVTNMIMELDNTNFKSDDKCELVASTTMKHELDQTENTEVNIKSAKINEDYMAKNMKSTRDPKDRVTETRELNKIYIIESTEFYKDMNVNTDDLSGTTEVNKSDITEITDIKKDCITKNTVGNKNDRTGITDVVADSKNKTVITVNTIPKTSSPESASKPTRQLRKREEKSGDSPRRVEKLETVLLSGNITCIGKTPTVSNASNETIKRCRGRPKKQVYRVIKRNEEHQEIISLNTDLNSSNENVFKVSSKDVSDKISTNNISTDKNILETEPNLIVKEIEVRNMIMELDNTNFKSNDNGVLVTSTPMKNGFDQTENTEDNIESAKINEDYMAKNMERTTDPKDHITENRELNKKYITESTDVIKNFKPGTKEKPEIIQVNKNDIIESTEFYKNMNVNTDDLAGTTEVNKSNITEDTDVIADSTETNKDNTNECTEARKYITESTKINEDDMNKSSGVVRDEKCIRDNNTGATNNNLEIKNTSEDNLKTINASLGVKTINLNSELVKITNVINNENTMKNNDSKVIEESPLPVIVNQQLNKESNSEKNYNEGLASFPVDCEKSDATEIDQNYKHCHSEGNNQQTLLDEEVSTINEYVDVENVQERQKEVESPVNITSRLRSKTSLGQRISISINTEGTPRSKTSLGKKSKNSTELSPKSPIKQRRNSEKEYQNKDEKESSPRTRNNIKTVSRLLEYDDYFKETNKSSLKERITSLEDILDGYSDTENVSTRTRSKTSLGERIDGNTDEDFDTQKIVRSKSSLGNKVNDNERDSISPKVRRSRASLGNNKLSGNDRDSTIKNSYISDNMQSEISLEESQRASRSKNPVPAAEYLNETSEETDPSKILHRRSLMPVGREVVKVVKRSHSIGSVLDMNKFKNNTNLKPKVGDIVWAQIGRYPYWPSLVSKDPVSRTSRNIVKNKCMYHVKFFGDKGRRAWINGKKLMRYKGRDDLEMCYKNLKNYKNAADLQVYIVKSYVSMRWTKAVEEVEFVTSQNFTYKQILRYMDTGCTGDESLNKESEEGECSTSVLKKVIKRKQSLSLDNSVDNNDQGKKIKLDSEESTPTSKEKSLPKGKTKDAETSGNSHTSSPKTEESSTSNDNQETVDFIIIKDEHSEEEYKINFNTLKNFGSYTLDEQRSLFKRNNLFKGIPKEKVCQYCFDFGELLKCKGGCNGVYHPYCATQVLLKKHPKRKKVRRSVKLEKEESIKTEKPEAASSSGNQLDVDNHVQIVTIHSSVYDTPPRKTFPPDFENMTLGERIDFKMKEIMKKFESTTYTDVLSESSSEEKPTRNIPLVCSSFSAKCQDLFSAGIRRSSEQSMELDKELDSLLQDSMIPLPSAAKSIKHVTADSPGGQNDGIQNSSSESIGKIQTDQPVKHVTADCEYSSYIAIKNNISVKKETKNQSKQRNSLMKHVTADSPSSRQHSTENKDFPSEPVETKTFNGHKKLKQETDNVDSESLRSSSSRQSKQSDMSENPDAYRNINPKNFKCGFCVQDVDPYCFICNETASKRGSYIRQKCSLYQCSRFYHPECLKLWPQTQWSVIQTTKNRYSQEEIDSFVCPQHVCHTCASDDPRAAISRCSGDKIVKCLCCPTSYHSTNLCVPAGAEIITSTQIICPRHRSKRNKPYTINTTWCLLCNQGGNLICCETCPTSVHPECMTVSLTDDDRFICEDCESGRLPLYDEVVWVKLGYYKWWPALIIFPNEVPQKVYNAKHSSGEFVVKFFGTYNYYWMNRGRAFLFQEGDTVDTGLSTKKKVEAAFLKAVKEAVVAHKMKKKFKLAQSAESANLMKPPPYIKIKVSKPVGNVRFMELDLSNTTACDCNPNHTNPCGPDSNCLNRLLLTECNPEVCPAGKLCKNQSFEQREYPLLIPYKTETRGWGLKTLEPVKKGQFVIEYVGELIDDEEYQRRILKMHAQKEENYYFLTIHKDRMIDAGPKGNMARFMNHCCQPNCETQKWTVNGDTRVGLFANMDIPAHTELTFNYNLECTGTEKKVCKCGAPNCSGFIGVKVKNELNENRKPKKERKKKEPEKPLVLPPCYQCQKKGNVSLCNNKICNKAYHLRCLKLKEMPEGKKFVCPWHYCNICSKRTIRCCVKCLNSFCPPHSEGNVRYDNLLGFVCSTHDPVNIKPQTSNVMLRKKRNHHTTDEAVVTSTTDDNDDDVDDVSLLERQRQLKKSTNNVALEDENVDYVVSDSCTFNPQKEADNESQNETVSSATASDFEDEFRPKRKKKPKKRLQDKRLRLKCKNVGAHNKVSTANSLNESEVSEVAR